MRKLLKKSSDFILKAPFISNVLTLMTGTAFAQLVTFATVPLILKYYRPDDFGNAAIFIGLSFIISVIATLRFELAIVLPARQSDASMLALASGVIATVISFAIYAVIAIYINEIIILTNATNLDVWIKFIPLQILLLAWSNILNYWHVRQKKFKLISIGKFIQTLTNCISQLIIGIIFPNNVTGLILGQILSQAIYFCALFLNAKELFSFRNALRFRDLIRLISDYKKFPLYSSWSIYANVIAWQAPIFLLARLFSPEIAGLYSFALKIVQAPFNLMTNALSQVYYQRITDMKNNNESVYIFTKKVISKNIIIGAALVLLFILFVDFFFAFFDRQWLEAAKYAKVIIILFFLNYIGSTISPSLSLYGLQKFELVFNFGLLFFFSGSIFVGYKYFNSPLHSIILLSTVGSGYYMYLTYYLISYIRSYETNSI